MNGGKFGLLELGSCSLKFYLVNPEVIPGSGGCSYHVRTVKFPWSVAHRFFRTGRLEPEAVEEIVALLRRVENHSEGIALRHMLALATGVFREIPSLPEVLQKVRAETGVRIRVIAGEDEARLMANDYLAVAGAARVFLFDLGGATTEWAFLDGGRIKGCGSLRLGAIRHSVALMQAGGDPQSFKSESKRLCSEQLKGIKIPEGTKLIGAGGTVKAAAKCTGSPQVSRRALEELIERVIREGPPSDLKPHRRKVLLPGLLILWNLVQHFGAAEFTYGKASVKGGMAGRLVRLLSKHPREDLHATLLLYTRTMHR